MPEIGMSGLMSGGGKQGHILVVALTTPDTRVANWPVNSCEQDGWKLVIAKRGPRAIKLTGLTWIVQRSFAWLGRNRRMSKHYEYMVQSSETMIGLATIRPMFNRLTCS
jgi:hypothetical protein